MTTRRFTVPLAGFCCTLFSVAGCAHVHAEPDNLPAIDGKIESLTVFPIVMVDAARQDVADVVALMLEKEGLANVTTTDAVFTPVGDEELAKDAAAFGEFVRQSGCESDYALLGHVLGSPKIGVQEVRLYLATGDGRLVWQDRQTPADRDFQRVRPRNPMTCCVLMSARLKPYCDKSAGPNYEGAMARKWREKSELPPKAEFKAIEQRRKAMKERGSDATIELRGVRVNSEMSAARGKSLRQLVHDADLGAVTLAEPSVTLEVEMGSNEQQVLWELAHALQEQVRAHPPETEYVLYAHYMIRPHNKKIHAVHTVICDKTGDWVVVDFQNEYQTDFKHIEPQTPADCDRLVVERLKSLVG